MPPKDKILPIEVSREQWDAVAALVGANHATNILGERPQSPAPSFVIEDNYANVSIDYAPPLDPADDHLIVLNTGPYSMEHLTAADARELGHALLELADWVVENA